MQINLDALPERLCAAAREILPELGMNEGGAFRLTADCGDRLEVTATIEGAHIVYPQVAGFFAGLKYLAAGLYVRRAPRFSHAGVMVDCSRNAVLKPDAVKRLIRLLAAAGFDQLQLYTEDTYEIEGQPYFGYMRGRYTGAELKELDAYAARFGVELVPCIQTLAHLATMLRWGPYRDIHDCNDILLVDEDKTYALIDAMFAALEKNFTSRRVNIGMDEAHMLGLGRFLDKHGYERRYDIMIRHLNRVLDIAAAHGFKPMMWSDMFFRMAFGGDYTQCGALSDEFKRGIPKNVELIYWDYYNTDEAVYERKIASHRQLGNELRYAGGGWAWTGLSPHNDFSLREVGAALRAAERGGIDSVSVTVWGDDGGECPVFSVLPALAFTGEFVYGGDLASARACFPALGHCSFDEFMTLDLPNALTGCAANQNPSKYLLYNDPFLGLLDSTVTPGESSVYPSYAARLKKAGAKAGEFQPLFATAAALCRVLADKAELGLVTRAAYRAGDRAKLESLVQGEYARLDRNLAALYAAYSKQWALFNKPFGMEVQDARLGGLRARVAACRARLRAYLDGTLDRIEELEQDTLDYNGAGAVFARQHIVCVPWSKIITAGVATW